MGCLDGKAILVTGAGRGVGRAEARLLASEGASLLLNDVGCEPDGSGSDPSVVQEVAREIESQGGKALSDSSDVSEPGVPEALVQFAVDELGRLDGLVANAGIRRDRGVLKTKDEDIRRVLDVHVSSSFALTRATGRVLSEQGDGGAIVLTSAPTAFFGTSRQALGAAANAGVAALTRSAAVELRRYGVRVNAIAPTARTRLTEDLPLFRDIAPESMSPAHVAPVAAFLLSEMASDVYGEVVGVAGGRVYSFRSRESTGAFAEGRPFTPAEVRDAWSEITRGG